MRLKELNVRPEEDGRVIIPAEVLEAIGTNADGTVYVTYLAKEDGGGLEVGELTPDQLYEDGTHLTVPEELLEEAGIQPDEDLEVVCEDRRIIILPARAGVIVPHEILELCSEIGINPEKVRIIMEMGGLDGRSEEDVPNRGR